MTNAGFMRAGADRRCEVTTTEEVSFWLNFHLQKKGVWLRGQRRDDWTTKTGVGFTSQLTNKHHPHITSYSSLSQSSVCSVSLSLFCSSFPLLYSVFSLKTGLLWALN